MKYILNEGILREGIRCGKSYSEMGREWGVSRSAVSQLVKKFGLRVEREKYLAFKRKGYGIK